MSNGRGGIGTLAAYGQPRSRIVGGTAERRAPRIASIAQARRRPPPLCRWARRLCVWLGGQQPAVVAYGREHDAWRARLVRRPGCESEAHAAVAAATTGARAVSALDDGAQAAHGRARTAPAHAGPRPRDLWRAPDLQRRSRRQRQPHHAPHPPQRTRKRSGASHPRSLLPTTAVGQRTDE